MKKEELAIGWVPRANLAEPESASRDALDRARARASPGDCTLRYSWLGDAVSASDVCSGRASDKRAQPSRRGSLGSD